MSNGNLATLRRRCAEVEMQEARLAKVFGVDTLENIPSSRYGKAMYELQLCEKENKPKGQE